MYWTNRHKVATILSMTTLTHIVIGSVIAKAALTGYATGANPALMYAVAIVFSNIPDSDIPLYGIRKSMQFTWNHRLQSFFHWPLFWFSLFALFQIFAPSQILAITMPYFSVALLSVALHFFMDTVGIYNGIYWFRPFIKKEMSFTKLSQRPNQAKLFVVDYCKSTVFKMELILMIGSVFFFMST